MVRSACSGLPNQQPAGMWDLFAVSMIFWMTAMSSGLSYSFGMPMFVVMSFGPMKSALTPGMAQMASRFSTERTDSIIGTKSVSAHLVAMYSRVFSLGH